MTTLPLTVHAPAVTSKPVSQRAYRLDSIDFLRGLVIVIMALDHTRDFFLIGHAQDPTKDPHVLSLCFSPAGLRISALPSLSFSPE